MNPAPVWLINTFIYLCAAVLAVPLAKKPGLGFIIGYLAAGIAIGPWGLGLVTNVQNILHFAEFGVVLMLFLVDLELQPARLWSLRRPIFGWGSAQLLPCSNCRASRPRPRSKPPNVFASTTWRCSSRCTRTATTANSSSPWPNRDACSSKRR